MPLQSPPPKSARMLFAQKQKRSMLVLGAVVLFFVFVLSVKFITHEELKNETPCTLSAELVFPQATFRVLVRTTPEGVTRGLSGHPGLRDDEGMLFLFAETGIKRFWMKEMRFPIDIVWLDEQFQVTGVSQHALPESYPNIFASPSSTRHVLEINAGNSQKYGITEGVQATYTDWCASKE